MKVDSIENQLKISDNKKDLEHQIEELDFQLNHTRIVIEDFCWTLDGLTKDDMSDKEDLIRQSDKLNKELAALRDKLVSSEELRAKYDHAVEAVNIDMLKNKSSSAYIKKYNSLKKRGSMLD